MLRRILFIILLLTVGLSLLLSWRVELGSRLLSWYLQQRGCRSVTVLIETLDFNQVVLSALQFSWSDQHQNIDLQLRHLAVDFDPMELVQGRIDSVVVESAVLHHRAGVTHKSTVAFDPSMLSRQQFSAWQKILPLKRLQIDQLVLSGKSFPPPLTQKLKLSFTQDSERAQLRLSGQGKISAARFEAEFKQTQTIATARLLLGPRSDAETSVSLEYKDDRLTGVFSLDLEQIRSSERLMGLSGQIPSTLKGRLAGTLEAKLDQFSLSALELQARIEKFSLENVVIEDLRLTLNLTHEVNSNWYVLNPGSKFELSRLNSPSATLAQLWVDLDGRVKGQKSDWEVEIGAQVKAEKLAAAMGHLERTELKFSVTGEFHQSQLKVAVTGEDLWRFQNLSRADLSVERFSCLPRLSAVIDPELVVINFAPDFKCSLKNLNSDAGSITDLELTALGNNVLQLRRVEAFSWSVNDQQWRLLPGEIEAFLIRIRPEPVTLNISAVGGEEQDFHLAAETSGSGMEIQSAGSGFRLKDIAGRIQLRQMEISSEISFKPERFSQSLTLNLTHDLNCAKGHGRLWTGEALLLDENRPLSRLLTTWSYPFDLVGGALDLELQGGWEPDQPLTATSQLRLNEISGWFREMHFSGLSLQQSSRLLPTFQTLEPVRLSLLQLNPGIPINNLEAVAMISNTDHGWEINLDHAVLQLLGGTFSAEPLTYLSTAAHNLIKVRFQGLDLAQAAAQQKTGGLQVSGLVDGTLPLDLSAAGIKISDGKVWEHGPGRIIYQPDNTAGGKGASLDLLISALEDFHYQTLRTGVEYQPDGDLTLDVHLEGKNPKLSATRPVHLNLNLQQNLLSLIKSLSYSQSIDHRLKK